MAYELVPGCPVCEHADRELIDEELAAGAKAKLGTAPGQIARRYAAEGFDAFAVWQHVHHSLPERPKSLLPVTWNVAGPSI